MAQKSTLFPDRRKKRLLIATFFVILIITMMITITAGVYPITVNDVYLTVFQHLGFGNPLGMTNDIVVWEIRIPRVILAALVGAALAISGAVFQGVFRNPLVEPYIMGVSSGAAVGAGIAIMFGFIVISLQCTAFLFGVFAAVLAYSFATIRRETPLVNLILAGIVVNAMFDAGLAILKTIAPYGKLQDLVFWLMGGFGGTKWGDVSSVGVQIFIGVVITSLLGWQLNLLAVGEEDARSLGLHVQRVKAILLGLAIYLTSISVATVGIIAWVGLIMPHISRMIVGPDHRILLPASALIGAIFLVLCDTLARTVMTAEIPISIITSAIGGPYLLYLIRKNRSFYFR